MQIDEVNDGTDYPVSSNQHRFALQTVFVSDQRVGWWRSFALISLDTHPAFSHTLPSKIIETNWIQKGIGRYFTSSVAAESKF